MISTKSAEAIAATAAFLTPLITAATNQFCWKLVVTIQGRLLFEGGVHSFADLIQPTLTHSFLIYQSFTCCSAPLFVSPALCLLSLNPPSTNLFLQVVFVTQIAWPHYAQTTWCSYYSREDTIFFICDYCFTASKVLRGDF